MITSITLYNNFHLGDLWLIKQIISDFYQLNKNKFKISIQFIDNGYAIYNDIDINLITNNLKNLPNNKSWFIKDDILFINLWCQGGNFKASDISISLQSERFKNIVNEINSNLELNLKYELPKDIFININNNDALEYNFIKKNDKMIFYYNIKPRSNQYSKNVNDEKVLKTLSTELKDYTIIIPKKIKYSMSKHSLFGRS